MKSIMGVFPEAQFVHMLRDGVEVTHSWSQHGLHKREVEKAAYRWKKAIQTVDHFGSYHSDQLIEIRYEELCRNPEGVVRHLCNFLSVQYEGSLLSRSDHHDEMKKAQSVEHFQNAFNSITTNSIGKGRRVLTDAQKREIAPVIDDELLRLNYDSTGD